MTDIKLKEKEIVLSKERELLDAMKNSNIGKLDELIHQDLIFNTPDGQTITKMMNIEAYKSGNIHINEIESGEVLLSIIGDNATISVIIRMKGKYINQPFDESFRFLRVWKKLNNQWKVITGSSLQLES